MLRHVLALSAFTVLVGACASRSSLGSGDDNLNQGGSSGSGATGGNGTGGGTAGSGGGGTWEPCAGKPCGAECSECAPNDPTCAETAVLKYCDQNGGCGMAFPVCDPAPSCKSDEECPAIGAPCQDCGDGTFACPWSKCENGQCVSGFDSCQGQVCKDDGDCPAIMAPCQDCGDGTIACPWTKCENGQCVGGFPGCGGYEPCAGKACGDTCTQCDPNDPTCAETAVLKYCDASGGCNSAYPVCEPPGQCKADQDCPAIELCKQCPGGSCAEIKCLDGQCGFQCPPPSNPECQSAGDCVGIELCMDCGNGTCAQMDCVNGQCEFVCK